MASEKSQINPRVLILFMFIGIIPMAVGALILINAAKSEHHELSSTHLSQLAENAQINLSNYLQNRILQVDALGTVPDVRTVILSSNPREVTSEQEQIETDWENLDPNSSALLRSILGNPASRFLRDYVKVTPAFREVIVTDIYGRVVAATNKTSDYFQADERWWQNAYRQGTGGHFISDITFDESVSAYAIEIAEPVIDNETSSAIGVIKTAFDAQEIFGLVNSVEVGPEGDPMLMRGDGSIIVSPRAAAARQEQFSYFEEIRTAISNRRPTVTVGTGSDRLTIGLSRSRLQETYPELDWYLFVRTPYSATFGPLLNINTQFLYIVLFSLAVVMAASFVFSRVLSRPVIETDPHLEKL